MPRADDLPPLPSDAASYRSSKSPISVAILAGVACVPIVVAAGFLTDRPPQAQAGAVPGDITVLTLRGGLDAAPADKRPRLPTRAGY